MKKLFFISAIALCSSQLSIQAQTKSAYKIANKIHLEGNEKWDYLFLMMHQAACMYRMAVWYRLLMRPKAKWLEKS